MERARTEWLCSLGFEQDELMRDPGILFAVRRAEVDYLRPARLNDRLLVISRLTRVAGASLDFAQQIRRDDEEPVLCEGRVRVVCLRAGDLRPTRIPQQMLDRFPSQD